MERSRLSGRMWEGKRRGQKRLESRKRWREGRSENLDGGRQGRKRKGRREGGKGKEG